jgi:hypothetical protein
VQSQTAGCPSLGTTCGVLQPARAHGMGPHCMGTHLGGVTTRPASAGAKGARIDQVAAFHASLSPPRKAALTEQQNVMHN